MTRFEMIKDTLKEVFNVCPLCKGEGGERDVILDDGSGPWYQCQTCKGTGYISVFEKIYLKILFCIWEMQKKAYEKKYETNRGGKK